MARRTDLSATPEQRRALRELAINPFDGKLLHVVVGPSDPVIERSDFGLKIGGVLTVALNHRFLDRQPAGAVQHCLARLGQTILKPAIFVRPRNQTL